MAKYTRASKPHADWWNDDNPLVPSLEAAEFVATDTGLIWETGEPIMREPNPLGFGRDDEW